MLCRGGLTPLPRAVDPALREPAAGPSSFPGSTRVAAPPWSHAEPGWRRPVGSPGYGPDLEWPPPGSSCWRSHAVDRPGALAAVHGTGLYPRGLEGLRAHRVGPTWVCRSRRLARDLAQVLLRIDRPLGRPVDVGDTFCPRHLRARLPLRVRAPPRCAPPPPSRKDGGEVADVKTLSGMHTKSLRDKSLREHGPRAGAPGRPAGRNGESRTAPAPAKTGLALAPLG